MTAHSSDRPAPLPPRVSQVEMRAATAARDDEDRLGFVLGRFTDALGSLELGATASEIAMVFHATLVDLLGGRDVALDLAPAEASMTQPTGVVRCDARIGGETFARIHVHGNASPLGPLEIGVLAGASPLLAMALRAERVWRESASERALLRAMGDASEAPMVAVDAAGRIRHANPPFLALLGRAGDVRVGMRVDEDAEPDVAIPLAATVALALQGESTRIEVRVPPEPGGRARQVQFATSPVRDETGAVVGAVATGRDVSDVRRLQAQVIRADRLATLGRSVAETLHEINNPLAAVIAYSEIVGRRVTDVDDAARIDRVRAAALRIQTLSRTLLAHASPRPGGPEALSVRTVIEDAVAACAHVMDAARVSLEVAFDDGLISVRGVAGELVQVFVNLIANACHAMSRDGGVLVIEVRSVPAGVRVRVTDGGVGIAPRDLPNIFDPFFTTRGEEGGTGLGLAVVRHILDTHGATLEVQSQQGRGTTFAIVLPAARPSLFMRAVTT